MNTCVGLARAGRRPKARVGPLANPRPRGRIRLTAYFSVDFSSTAAGLSDERLRGPRSSYFACLSRAGSIFRSFRLSCSKFTK